MSRDRLERASEVKVIHVLGLPEAFQAFAWLVVLSIWALVLYVGQFEVTNASDGILSIREIKEFSYWLMLSIWLSIMALLFPMRVRSPSDVFLSLYLLGAALWTASLWPATGLINQTQTTLLGCMLLFPALLVVAARWFVRRVRVLALQMTIGFSRSMLLPTLAAFLFLASMLGYKVAGADASLDFETGFLRRLAGRDSFAENGVAAYLMQMSANGIAPFLAYLGVQRRSVWALAFAFGFAIFSFWLLALKAPILNVSVLAALGYLARSGRIVNFSRWLMVGLATLLFAAIVELLIFDFSLIADYGVRRLILVNSIIQVYFVDALSQLDFVSLLSSGIELIGYATPEYLVGSVYMGNQLTNANTNAYLHQTASSGLLGYALVVIGTALVTGFLDFLYIHWRIKDGFAISAMLGILLIEQAFSITMVSSGLLLCLFFSFIFSGPDRIGSNGQLPLYLGRFS